MIIAIDYDYTYSAAPELFNQIIKLFQDNGHTVICVTGRSEELAQPVMDSIGKLVPVILAGKDWKLDAANKRGYKVDIWIDDMPGSIHKHVPIL